MLAEPSLDARPVTITNAYAFVDDMKPVTISIDQGRLRELDRDRRRSDTVIDAQGRFVLPGLIDAHAHLSMLESSSSSKGSEPRRPGTTAHLIATSLRKALRMGVTTIRDVGAYGDVLFEIRQAMRLGAFVGPRLLLSGRIVAATSPGDRFFPEMYRVADGPDEMRRAVREQIRAGADFVKIMATGARTVELEDPGPAQVTRAEMQALVDEAHRQGYRVSAHCEGIEGTALAIEEGADTIEHGMHLHQRPDLLDQLARHRGVLVPTISFLHELVDGEDWTPLLTEQGESNVQAADLTIKAAKAAGLTLAMGFDSPQVWRSAKEIVTMVDHGLTPAEALVAATRGGAIALGIEDDVGSLEEGQIADLVIVDGNPLEDPSILLDPDKIWLVFKSGQPVAGAALERVPWA